MYYPIGKYTGLYVLKNSADGRNFLTTRRKDALSFALKRDAEAWVDEHSYFDLLYVKVKRKKKGGKRGSVRK